MVSLHIEPTSRCTLACPRCERTTFIEKFGKKYFTTQDLDIDAFAQFVDTPVDTIQLCGNLGDPIYHRNFLELVSVCKSLSKRIKIITNGSKKSTNWWNKLCNMLGEQDNITFSIDGTPENFTQYRINADWPSIQTGIQACVDSPATVEWKYIVFDYNQNDIQSTELLSKQLGVDIFWIEHSNRWLPNDPLRPDDKYIAQDEMAKQTYKHSNRDSISIDPKCKKNTFHYVGSDGYYTPCCDSRYYVFYYKSDWWKNRKQHHISTSKLSDQCRHFDKFYSTIQTERYDYCVYNCGKC